MTEENKLAQLLLGVVNETQFAATRARLELPMHKSVHAESSADDGSPLKFPQVPGVSQETLALIRRQEAWPVESSGDELTARLEERKRIINEYALLDPFHAKRYPRRIKFAPGFMDTLEGHLADIERMRLRKRKNRRKTTKKRKQRLMGKR